ncbi:4-pyridoxate dehydrogenase [Halyomorpha halys]|uniref:4-pyridoxate dehydrogenase n=1 Tax=Halyomorpha halys TaxID=286706 RepID=UPI0006D4EF70|nr:glucose dehydrogenase [FAD, quinone]-like [Halyomorpha halys]
MTEFSFSKFVTAFLAAVYLYYPESTKPSQVSDTPQLAVKSTYDFVIVGGGSAGCVLANRLTENPNWNILLIEAGGDGNALTDAPLFHTLIRNTIFDWNYTTVKQERACLHNYGICPYPRGKVMGGSSTTNAMLYVRGNKADYDDWAAKGCHGWSYEDLLPYFIKAENNTEPSLAASHYHGVGGPLNVQFPSFFTILRDMFIKAAEEFGWRRGDYNGEWQNVAGYVQTTIAGSSREDTSKAYLNPIKNRKNLFVIKNAIVTKILINNKVTKGVKYNRGGKTYKVFARKEVILSAGAINTPKLLMLSGIGPKDELEMHNIKLIKDLPVGKNLQDHLQVQILFEIDGNMTYNWRTEKSINQYAKERTGPLTTPTAETMAFLNIHNNSHQQPNLQFTWFSGILPTKFDDQKRNIITIIMVNVKPKSVGRVRLESGSCEDMPLIDTNFFSEESDFAVYQKGFEYLLEYMKTPTMLKLSPTLYTEYYHECKGKNQKDLIRCIISRYSQTIFHPVGTAKMGSEETGAVVNPDLQVYGVRNLRVIDASIMPTIPSGNTNAPTIMIAEKGSDLIKRFYS